MSFLTFYLSDVHYPPHPPLSPPWLDNPGGPGLLTVEDSPRLSGMDYAELLYTLVAS